METINVELVNNIDSANSVIYVLSDGEYIEMYPTDDRDVRNCTGITTIIHEMFHLLGFGHIAGEKNSILRGHTEILTDKDREMISLLYKK